MCIISVSFLQHRVHLVNYVNARVKDYALAEDLVQDAFLHLLEMKVGVRTDSVERLLFTICRNLVLDHLRRKMLAERINIYMYAQEETLANTTEQAVRVHEIAAHEMRVVSAMPAKRQQVYRLSRYEGMAVDDIAVQMGISHKTVEAHLFTSRKEVREKLKAFAS